MGNSRTASKGCLVLIKMQIFVKTDRTHTLQVGADATAYDVKEQIAALQGVSVEEQRLMFGTRQLADESSLVEAGVSDESAMYVLLRLLGGAKKRKKKTHNKVKLAVLNFYKVDDSGKVQRMRKVCPEPSCGPGIFMATHFNRVYCGKCG